ncbi:hypothetical protein [Nonomuraea insulae]|uniref:Outer membrane protein assembly factor BamB n=1 Tax=Nonomuraea insulae TaxID=1616787 RepID=A0ABW1CW31_9ACTN
MNDLEERLRAAFDARAHTFETSPDAWIRLRERRPWRRGVARLAVAALPVALLAVFVPVLLNGGLGSNTAADADAIYEGLMRDRTATGELVTVDNPTEGKPLRLWFARAQAGYPEMCFVLERAAAEPYGGCTPLTEELDTDAWFVGSTLRDGAESALDWGVTLEGVGGITGVAADGQRFPGTVSRPVGVPYRIWTVTYPVRHPMSSIEIADDQGRKLGSWSRDMLSDRPSGKALGDALELPAGVVARPYESGQGTEVAMSRHGKDLASVLLKGQEPVQPTLEEDVIAGVARKDVARVELTLPSGAKVQAETRPDPWGLGVTLFATGNPAGGWINRYGVVAYDASGGEVWRRDIDDQQTIADSPVIGEAVALPGTGIRAWFTSFGKDMTSLCRSGGVSPWGGENPTCFGAGLKGRFSHEKAVTYLPEPGAVTYYGVVLGPWKSVEAVLSDGRRVRAGFLRGKGAPAAIWHVTIPSGDVVLAGFTVTPQDGPLERYPEAGKSCGRKGVTIDAGRQALPEDMAALVVPPSCLAFFWHGEPTASLAGPLPGEKLSDLLWDRPAKWTRGAAAWYGYAPKGTTSVHLVTSNGRTATAKAVPDRWGQGVTLFAGPWPEGGDFSAGTYLVGYDAGGAKLWQDGPVKREN